jgi:UDP-galactopyranose mutase
VVAERIASQLDQRVLVIDRRNYIGGNAYDYRDAHGILVHRHGPHILHTNVRWVWDYLSRFTEWWPYDHRVLAWVKNRYVPVPFNLTSLHLSFPARHAAFLERLLLQCYGHEVKVPILTMLENKSRDLRELGEYIYRNVFENYTTKQWGVRPEQLDPSVTGRVPVYISRDDRYFQDRYQGMPLAGYTEMFQRILDHPNIEVALNTDYRTFSRTSFDRMVFTGPLDSFFDYVHGPLPYRSLHFDYEFVGAAYFQPAGQVNFPNDHLYTRITEFKHMTGQEASGTSIAREFPQAHVAGQNEPYYPVPVAESAELYARYRAEVAKLKGEVLFAGRLADYKYYNMDQAVVRAFELFEEIAQPRLAAAAAARAG